MTDQERLDHTPIRVGRYSKGPNGALTPSQIAEVNPGYIVWFYETRGPGYRPCSDALYRDCVQTLEDDAHSPLPFKDQE